VSWKFLLRKGVESLLPNTGGGREKKKKTNISQGEAGLKSMSLIGSEKGSPCQLWPGPHSGGAWSSKGKKGRQKQDYKDLSGRSSSVTCRKVDEPSLSPGGKKLCEEKGAWVQGRKLQGKATEKQETFSIGGQIEKSLKTLEGEKRRGRQRSWEAKKGLAISQCYRRRACKEWGRQWIS